MASELKPESLRKKELANESLEAFLARMAVVWHERQARLAVAVERARAAALRSMRKRQSEDPEGFAQARRDASRRYEERHRKALRDRERRMRERLAPALLLAAEVKRAEKAAQRAADKARKAVERGAKRANRAKGYPQHQPNLPACEGAVTSTWRGPVDSLSRAWFGQALNADARPEKQSSLASE